MPEGHTIHRKVVDQGPHLVGHPLAVSAPSGRLAHVARALDGRLLTALEAYGKHLFYVFDGRRVLHVHLGMDGRFRHHRGDVPPPARSSVLRVGGPGLTFDLSRPKIAEAFDVLSMRKVIAHLGPDPIREDSDGAEAVRRWAGYDGPSGVALLDQSLAAGIGNVYRAEILFAHRIHPETPAAAVGNEQWHGIWATARRLMRKGVADRGDIITVDSRDFKVRDGRQTYVYGQRLCAHCGHRIRSWDLDGREAWACENCQPRPA